MSSKTEPGRAEHAPKQTARLEALSDGIFAIAMTLLVLDIHVPVIRGGESLLRALIADWPTHLAFLIGFFTLLICWINHHYMLELIQQSNGITFHELETLLVQLRFGWGIERDFMGVRLPDIAHGGSGACGTRPSH